MTRSRRSRGFTLIEALVALAILAVGFAALMQAFGSGLAGLDRAQNHTLAALQARSKLAEVGSVISLEEGLHEGDFENGGRWRVDISTMEGLEAVGAARNKVAPFHVVVEIEAAGGGFARLETLRLGESQ